jgi:hypothetical protein
MRARLPFCESLKGGEKTKKEQSSEGSSERCTQCGQLLPSKEPIRLRERDIFWGPLQELSESEDEDMILAKIECRFVEVPKELAGQLQELVGKDVVIGKFDGKYRTGAKSDWCRPLTV